MCGRVSSYLPLGHAAVVLGPLLEQLSAQGLLLLLQTALSLQLAKLQVLKLLGPTLQGIGLLHTHTHTHIHTRVQAQAHRETHPSTDDDDVKKHRMNFL